MEGSLGYLRNLCIANKYRDLCDIRTMLLSGYKCCSRGWRWAIIVTLLFIVRQFILFLLVLLCPKFFRLFNLPLVKFLVCFCSSTVKPQIPLLLFRNGPSFTSRFFKNALADNLATNQSKILNLNNFDSLSFNLRALVEISVSVQT